MNRVAPVLAVMCLLGSPVAAGGAQELGSVVSAVELRLDAPLGRRTELEPLLAIRPGTALTDDDARRTLSNLQATGLFTEIEILIRRDGSPESPGSDTTSTMAVDTVPIDTVTVVVVLRAQTWVSSVELRGEREISDRALLRVVTQKEASPLVEARIRESQQALETLYHQRGYRQARVLVSAVPTGPKRVDLVIEAESGPRAMVGEIVFEGAIEPFSAPELRTALKSATGSKYDRERIETDAVRLRTWLARRGHLRAEVGIPREAYDRETNRMDLTYPVTIGPEIALEATGTTRKWLKRKGFLPFLDKEVLDDLALTQHCTRIRDHLQRKGHYRAEVLCGVEERQTGPVLAITVEPGDVYQLTQIGFAGNEQIADEELLPLMATSPRSPLSPGSGRLVRKNLDEDLDNLRSYYLLQGFGEVEIGTFTIIEGGRSLELEIDVVEGPRQRLVDFTFAGVEMLDLDRIRASLPLAPGSPFHPVLLDDSLNIVRALYEDEGFPSVVVTPRLDWNDDRTLVDIHLEVDEGPQAIVDRLILRGQRRTKTDVVRRFVRLQEGEPVSRRRLLEVERDLYRLGIFSKVDVEQRSVAESSARRDVVVRLEEGRRYRLAYGVSYDSDDGLGGLLSITRANIGGRGDRLQLDLRGTERESTFRLLYDQPLLWHYKLPVTYSLFGQEEDRESFSVDNVGAQVAVTRDLPSVRLRAVAEYRSVEISQQTIDFEDLDPGDIDREDREVEIFSLIPILYIDRRDNPLDPELGWSTAVQLEYALPFAQAETNFLKLFWQQTQYVPFGRFGSLAASWRFGAIEPLDDNAELDPLVPPDLPSALVPVSERFFAGGRTSHRAYERDRLGILGETLFLVGEEIIEAGGNGLAVLNLDYRFPITGPVGGIVFFDIGNVWADWRDLDPSDFKPGAGLGVRYASPIGPIRLEIGWKLDAEPDEDDAPVFFLSFGNPF
ncbi:MAG: BamA/TamA family outer membrane protein [bacterium]|nr:BamA/TamA family outer membrane protein [bacterium]